jgi:hypothetical protein
MDCTPEQAKDFVMEMQVYVSDLLQKRLPFGWTLSERLDLANEITDYAFALMLKTHRGEKIKTETDDDIPF